MKLFSFCVFFLFECHFLLANCIVVGSGEGKYPEKTGEMIQRAIDELSSQGGGVVELAEGTFILDSTLYPKTNITLCGQGKKTILKKAPTFSYSKLQRPAYKGDKVIYVRSPSKFHVGQGVNIGARNIIANNTTLTKIQKIEGRKITIKDPIEFTCQSCAYIASNFSCLFVNFASNVSIRDFVIDGSRLSTPFISSWKIGGLKTWEAPHLFLKNIEIKNTCGDGLTLGRSNFAYLTKLYCHHTDLIALHLANGSEYVLMSDCIAHDSGKRDSFNGAGIFLCWNVQNSIIRNNVSYANEGGGISLGYNDSRNIFINNITHSNKKGGIRFRSDANGACKDNIFVSTKLDRNIPCPINLEGEPEVVFFDDLSQIPSNFLSADIISNELVAYLEQLNIDLEEITEVNQEFCDIIDAVFRNHN